MKQKIKKEKGITLIALVITIIVLLILAGVTINIAVNSGIMDKSEKAVSKYTEQEAKESLAIALLDYQMGMLAKDNSGLQDYLTDMGGVVTEETDDTYTVELGGYEFIIDKNSFDTTSLGETTGEKPNVGTPSVSLSSNGLEATITVSASATQGGSLTVTIGGETATNNGNGTYSKTVNKNGKYSILVSEEGGRKVAKSVEVTGITEMCTITLTKGEGISEVKVNNSNSSGTTGKGYSIAISATVEGGYEFDKWIIIDGEGTIAVSSSASTTVTPTSNVTIQAMANVKNGNNLTGSSNKTLNGGTYAYNNPVIPVGFKAINTTDAKWTDTDNDGAIDGWNNGLVIQDSSGNEFVWVPVDNSSVKYEKWCTTNVAYNNTNISDDSLPSGVTSETSQITKYGGFYIARYEAGIPESMTDAVNTASADARNVSGTPTSKQNQIPWNWINYNNSKANAESMYSTSYVQSGLLTGTMWDTVMLWLDNAGYSVTSSAGWGNHKDAAVTNITQYSTKGEATWTSVSSTTKEKSTIWLLKTGNSDYTKRKNIYDLAGNLWELTNEINSTGRLRRGGSCGYDSSTHPASYRGTIDTDYFDFAIGFRVGLYIK